MEATKSLLTGVHSVPGYAAVQYRLFTVQAEGESEEEFQDHVPLEEAEAQLHEQGCLVVKDVETGCLWSFEKKHGEDTTITDEGSQHEQSLLEGLTLSLIAQGTLKLPDIPKARLRAMVAASNKSPITPSAPNLTAQILNAKAVKANAGTETDSATSAVKIGGFDAPMVLPWFIASVEMSVSYQLASRLMYTPLNSRTWAVNRRMGSASIPPSDAGCLEPTVLLSLNAYITTAGILVLAFTSTVRSDVHRLSLNDHHYSGCTPVVRLAPNGSLAKVADAGGTGTATTPKYTSSKRRVVEKDDKFHDLAWQTKVRGWLSRKGIQLDPGETWVDVRISQDLARTTSAKEKLIQCLWPMSLCFVYSASTEISEKSPAKEVSDGNRWFSTARSTSVDPLELAQQWFLDKAERERAREARKKAAIAQQEQVPLSESALLPTSPFHTRPDLLAAGVYPTPPDGILSQPTATTQVVDTPYVAPSTVESHTVDATPSNPLANADDLGLDGTSPLDADKDLFGDVDMDEDNFAGNELSDADFNFFDEPDDIPMPDIGSGDSETPANPTDTGDAADSKRDSDTVSIKQDVDATSTTYAAEPAPISSPRKTTVDTAAMVNVPDTPAEKTLAASGQDPLLDRRRVLKSEPFTQQEGQFRFGNISFHDQVAAADAKYASGGIFGSLLPHDVGHEHQRTDRWRSSLFDRPASSTVRPSAWRNGRSPQEPISRGHASFTGIGRREIVTDSDTDDSLSTASVDDTPSWENLNHAKDDPSTEQRLRKRARPNEVVDSSDGTPMQTGDEDDPQTPDLDLLALGVENSAVISLFEPDYADWSLAQYPAPILERPGKDPGWAISFLSPIDASSGEAEHPPAVEASNDAFIGTAQLVSEQAAFGTLQAAESQSCRADLTAFIAHEGSPEQRIPVHLSATLTALFPDITQLELGKYTHIQDAPFEPLAGAKTLHRPAARKPTSTSANADTPSPNALFSINPQHVRVRRGETSWDLLPTALSFWEPLGLGPASGAKNILTYCLYPGGDALLDPLNGLLDALSSTYEGCKLGAHKRGPKLQSFPTELIAVHTSTPSSPTYGSVQRALRSLSARLGSELASLDATATDSLMQDAGQSKSEDAPLAVNSIVLYVVDVFETSKSARDLCFFFWSLREAYKRACRSYSPVERKAQLVLQILPISRISSENAPVFLDQKTLITLAREVYDRCPPNQTAKTSSLSIQAAPSVQLEETVPRAIPFRLTADSATELLHDCSHLHLGYALSWDGIWLTAAWTDGFGKYQTMASYNMNARTLAEVAKEVWQTTLSIMQTRKVTWRVTIAKAGVMERDEVEAWASLVSATGPMPVGAVLMTVDTSPSLQLSRTTQAPATANNPTITPVSTPQGVSPSDPSANAAATPTDVVQDAVNDPDAHLVDVTDDTWGVILSHRLSNSSSLIEIRPCLASGFLINKGSDVDGSSGPRCTGYNIIWIGSSSRPSASAAAQGQAQAAPTTPMTPGAQTMNASTAAAFAQGMAATAAQQSASQQQGVPQSASASGIAMTGATQRFGGATLDPILKEYLTVYRGLGMLARLRGMRGTKRGTVPWHIAAVLNSVDALERCMEA